MKRLFLKYSAAFIMSSLAGCSAAPITQTNDTNAAQTDQTEDIKAAGNDVSLNQPVIIPPGFNDRPIEPGKTETPTLPNGLPALGPAKGLKIDSLFTEEIKDTDKRIKRLENAHVDFRKEYEQLKPAIVRLSAIESDLQALMSELNGFVDAQSGAAIAPAPAVPVANTEPAEAEAPEPPTTLPELQQSDKDATPATPITSKNDTATANITIKDIRIGNHADKVRLVIEASAASNHTIDINNDDQIMVVTLEDAAISDTLSAEKTFPNNPLLGSYKITRQNNASQIILNLKRVTTLKNEETLNAKNESANARLVIDLAL